MIERCDFKNPWMKKECGEKVLSDGGEPYCIHHGTRRFLVRATDLNSEDEPSPSPAKSGEGWSIEDLQTLIEMGRAGFKIEEIAEALERSRNAVYNKLWSMSKEVPSG